MRRPCLRRVLGSALALAYLAVASLASADFPPNDDAGWELPNPDLYALSLHGDRAIAVGYWGTALVSDDRGETWAYRPTPTAYRLFGVSVADEQNAWAVGWGGVVIRSTDGGDTWSRVHISVPDEYGEVREVDAILLDVSAVSANDVWIVGDFGMLLHTTDGVNFERFTIREEIFADGYLPDRLYNGVEFSDSQNGWIAGEFGTVLRTTDGGQTWKNRSEIRGAIEDIYLFDIGVNGSEVAYTGGVGGVTLVTRDDGDTWDSLEVPSTAGLFGSASHGDNAVLVGDRGEVVVTSDGGSSWFQPERPKLFNWLKGAAIGDQGLVLLAGEKGLILRSTDGGKTFAKARGAEPGPASGITVPDTGPHAPPEKIKVR